MSVQGVLHIAAPNLASKDSSLASLLPMQSLLLHVGGSMPQSQCLLAVAPVEQ